MKRLITLIIFCSLMQLVFSQNPTRCWVSSDYDFNDTKGKGAVTICNRGRYITVVIPESGVYTFYTETENSFVDSVTKLYYTECVGNLTDYDKAFVFNRLGDKRIYVSSREWRLTAYNVTKKGMPAPAKKSQRYTGIVVEYIDSAQKVFKARNDSADAYRLAVLDTVRTDADELLPYLMNANSPRHPNGELASGSVKVEFYVEVDGSISNITPVSIKTESGTEYEDLLISNEAVRVIKSIAKLTPGTVKGVPTRLLMTQSFKFGY